MKMSAELFGIKNVPAQKSLTAFKKLHHLLPKAKGPRSRTTNMGLFSVLKQYFGPPQGQKTFYEKPFFNLRTYHSEMEASRQWVHHRVKKSAPPFGGILFCPQPNQRPLTKYSQCGSFQSVATTRGVSKVRRKEVKMELKT